MSGFLTDREVASWLHVSVAAVRRWRFLNIGPKFIKIGSAVRYDPSAVERWIASRPSGGDTDV